MKKTGITIKDISREAKVSPSTVSRVLNGATNVSSEKVARVKEVVAKYNYKPNDFARALLGKSTKVIGFILPDITNPYFSAIYYEFERIARQHGYTVLLGNSYASFEYESDLMRNYSALNIAALVLAGGRVDNPGCDQKYVDEVLDFNERIPIIALNKHPRFDGISQLYVNIEPGIYDLMAYLKRIGTKRLAVIGGVSDTDDFQYNRRLLYVNAARENGIEVRDEWLIPTDFSIDGGQKGVKTLYQSPDLPDTISCMNDIIAIGAMQELHAMNVDVPNEMMLTGFDGTFLTEVSYPSLTGLAYDFKRYAKAIYDEFEYRTDDNKGDVKTFSYLNIVVRSSTKR